MSRLDDLIAELCPDGVEFDLLGSVCGILDSQRKPVTKKNRQSGIYPYYGANGIQDYIDDYIFDGTFILMGEDGSVINKDNSPVLTWTTGKIWVNNHAHVLCETPRALLRFVYHYLQTIDVSPIVRGTPPKINQQSIRNIAIPLPPLPVQQEIVCILDNFTDITEELTAKLTAELSARKKQYEFYRNFLMISGDEHKVKWMTLGEVGPVCMCKRIMKAETSPIGDVPFYKIGTFGKEPDAFIAQEKYEEYRKKYPFPKKGDILISAAGTIGRTVIYDGKPAYYQDSNIVWIDNDESKVLNKYLYYCYAMKPWSVSTGGTIARLYNDNISKAKIPVPPLEEQQQIVAVLDRFDAICNDLNSSISAEIEARKKQYEYYRNKLLTFKETKA